MNLFPRKYGRPKQHGQVLVLFTVFLAGFLLLAALAIDFGFAYLTRARLTKALDSACLNAARVYSSTNPTLAQQVAQSAFYANWGSASPVPTVTPTQDPTNAANTLLSCNATATNNTFFARILPNWSTVNVTTAATAKHATLIMTLVVDRSGSMSTDGGWTAVTNAVPKFLAYFDNTNDYIGLVTFADYATTDWPITGTPGGFIPNIANKLNADRANGATFTWGGLSNGLADNLNVTVPGNAFKVIVLLTDGYANVIQDNLNCSGYNVINYGGHDYPDTTDITYIDPNNGTNLCTKTGATSNTNIPPNTCGPTTCTAQQFNSATLNGAPANFTETNVSQDAVTRSLNLATQLRTDANPTTIYTIGVGNSINTGFLQQMANDPSSGTYNPDQPAGAYYAVPSCTSTSAACTADVLQAYQNIAANILLRLTQ